MFGWVSFLGVVATFLIVLSCRADAVASMGSGYYGGLTLIITP